MKEAVALPRAQYLYANGGNRNAWHLFREDTIARIAFGTKGHGSVWIKLTRDAAKKLTEQPAAIGPGSDSGRSAP